MAFIFYIIILSLFCVICFIRDLLTGSLYKDRIKICTNQLYFSQNLSPSEVKYQIQGENRSIFSGILSQMLEILSKTGCPKFMVTNVTNF